MNVESISAATRFAAVSTAPPLARPVRPSGAKAANALVAAATKLGEPSDPFRLMGPAVESPTYARPMPRAMPPETTTGPADGEPSDPDFTRTLSAGQPVDPDPLPPLPRASGNGLVAGAVIARYQGVASPAHEESRLTHFA